MFLTCIYLFIYLFIYVFIYLYLFILQLLLAGKRVLKISIFCSLHLTNPFCKLHHHISKPNRLSVTGTVLKVNVIWPENWVKILHELLKQFPEDDWRIDVFPNLVAYRRQVEALKRISIKSYKPFSHPSSVVSNIVKTHHDYLSKGNFIELFVL